LAKTMQNTVKRQAEYRSEAGKMRTRDRQNTVKRRAGHGQETGRIQAKGRQDADKSQAGYRQETSRIQTRSSGIRTSDMQNTGKRQAGYVKRQAGWY